MGLKGLAKDYALEYSQAGPADVEDDVSFCVWVRKTTGEELTLEQAKVLREMMDAEIAKFPKVVIFVSGGVVTSCTSNDPKLQVVLIDRDALEENDDPEEAEAEALEGAEDCVHDVF